MSEISREYQRTHKWIDFQFNVQRLSPKAWLSLGQIQAKCDQISGTPLLPSVARDLHRIYLAKGVLATTAIEGNTLTEDEVLRLLEDRLELPPSKQYLATEVANIIKATNYIGNNLLQNSIPIELDVEQIKNYNRMIFENLEVMKEVVPGEFRHHDVRVATYKGAPSEDVPHLISRLCDWLNHWNLENHFKDSLNILKAIIAHVYIAWIHPFADGNGRTARLLEFQLLLSAGFPTPATHLLSNHYNFTRTEYYRYLQIASTQDGGIYYFVEYALQGFLDQLNEQIQYIEKQQISVHWENHIYTQFRNKNSKTDQRRRRLIMDLSKKDDPVLFADLRYLSPRIAEAYAHKSDLTIRRDLDELESMNLIVKTKEGIKSNSGIMRAFLPQKRT